MEIMEIDERVRDLSAHMHDKIAALDAKRKKYLLYAAIVLTLAVLFNILNHFFFHFPPSALPITLVPCFLIIGVLNGFYTHKAKKEIIEHLCAILGLTYYAKGVFPVSDIQRHKILPRYDKAECEDGFSGNIGHVPISFQEIILKKEGKFKDRDEKGHEEEILRGVMIRIGLKKKLASHTLVLANSKLGTFAKTAFSKYTQTKLAAPKFEKEFDLLTTDPLESHLIFDPAFTERFLDLATHLDHKHLKASFKYQELVILAQYTKNSFKFGHLLTPLTEERIKKVFNEIKVITEIVDVLKLNPHIGI